MIAVEDAALIRIEFYIDRTLDEDPNATTESDVHSAGTLGGSLPAVGDWFSVESITGLSEAVSIAASLVSRETAEKKRA